MFSRNFLVSARTFASHNRVKRNQIPIVHKPAHAQIDSLRARGFLRPQKAYDPPRNVYDTVNSIVKELGGVTNFKEQKFDLLNRCGAAFSNHFVPNQELFEIKSVDDVIYFYNTPVCTRTPYETLDTSAAPNLHVVQEYNRFNPEEDGVSAFPKSSTLVTGLKYRKKYKGHIAKTSWP